MGDYKPKPLLSPSSSQWERKTETGKKRNTERGRGIKGAPNSAAHTLQFSVLPTLCLCSHVLLHPCTRKWKLLLISGFKVLQYQHIGVVTFLLSPLSDSFGLTLSLCVVIVSLLVMVHTTAFVLLQEWKCRHKHTHTSTRTHTHTYTQNSCCKKFLLKDCIKVCLTLLIKTSHHWLFTWYEERSVSD